jgi:hypothetical protein
MTMSRKVFLAVFGLCLLLGLVIGVTSLVSPGSANVTMNGQQVTGMAAFWTALMIGGILGLVFGGIIGFIVKIFSPKKKRVSA